MVFNICEVNINLVPAELVLIFTDRKNVSVEFTCRKSYTKIDYLKIDRVYYKCVLKGFTLKVILLVISLKLFINHY